MADPRSSYGPLTPSQHRLGLLTPLFLTWTLGPVLPQGIHLSGVGTVQRCQRVSFLGCPLFIQEPLKEALGHAETFFKALEITIGNGNVGKKKT